MLSFSGVITFPKSDEIQEVVRRVPAERYMIETDAPFLAPVPNRGKRNEPAFVQHVAEMVAKLRNESLDEVARQTTKNAVSFFGLPEA
jgi:TatD DNase family protein